MTLQELNAALIAATGNNQARAQAMREYAETIAVTKPASAKIWRETADALCPLTPDEKSWERETR